MKELKKPPKLEVGDTVATVSLSWGGAGKYPWRYEAGVRQLQDLAALNVVPAPNSMRDEAWLSNNPEARADDLMWAFENKNVKAILSNIGGDDSIRLMPYIDTDTIAANPKIFMGYSDSTVTHFACLKAGLSSFYGPAIMAGFAENQGMYEYTKTAFKNMLMEIDPAGAWTESGAPWCYKQLQWSDPDNQEKEREKYEKTAHKFLQGEGVVEGRLIGGCLEVLEFLKGTAYWPSKKDWKDTILFIETSEEAPSPEFLKRCLRNYAAQGILDQVKAIFCGRPGGVDFATFKDYEDVIIQVVSKECGRTKMPIVTQMEFGHTDPMMILPYGRLVEINADEKEVSFKEGCVI